MEIAIVNLENVLEKYKYDRLISCVSIEKREKISKFYRYEDVLRALIGDILIRFLLSKRLKIKNQNLKFGVNKFGKPFLKNYTDVEFNISHSGKWVVCTLDDLPVGIDIEQIKTIDFGIAERFFSKDEIKSLMSKCIAEREDYFYVLWVLKESYIKAIGKGLSLSLDSFTLYIVEDHITVYPSYESINYYFRQYHIGKDYKMAVCSKKDKFPHNINYININELYEEFLLL
jgi:4'-phosphopantetheinyl transferase